MKTNRMDFLPADVLVSVIEVAIWIVHSYIRLCSRICVVSSLVARAWLRFKKAMRSSGQDRIWVRIGENHELVTETTSTS